MQETWLQVPEAWAVIEAAVAPLDSEAVHCETAAGRVLRETVLVDRDQPPFDRSAMDGFAVRVAEVQNASAASPVRLTVAGESTPGAPFEAQAGPGSAIRIMTGAPVPAGFEAVIPVEATSGFAGDRVDIRATARAGDAIVARGRERRAGAIALPEGRRLGPAQVGALALVGATRLRVGKRPRVAVLSTGDELVPHAETPDVTHIRNSNGPLLAALAVPFAREVVSLGIAVDDEPAIETALRAGLEYDLLLISGGVSMGAYDLVGAALERCGVALRFERVALQPGKPVTFGTHARGAVLALPGNPVSAFTTFRLFAALALARFEGEQDARPRFEMAPASFAWERRNPKWLLLPGRWTSDGVELLPYAGSGDLLGLANADFQVVLSSGIDRVLPGDRIPIWRL